MPAFAIIEQTLLLGRYKELLVSIYEIDGDGVAQPIAIAADDVVRAKLSSGEGTGLALDVSSDATLAGGSTIEIVTLGSVGNPDPDDDVPAQVKVIFDEDDTAPLADDWEATVQRKRYWLDLSLDDAADGHLKPFGRGTVMVHRSPGGLGV